MLSWLWAANTVDSDVATCSALNARPLSSSHCGTAERTARREVTSTATAAALLLPHPTTAAAADAGAAEGLSDVLRVLLVSALHDGGRERTAGEEDTVEAVEGVEGVEERVEAVTVDSDAMEDEGGGGRRKEETAMKAEGCSPAGSKIPNRRRRNRRRRRRKKRRGRREEDEDREGVRGTRGFEEWRGRHRWCGSVSGEEATRRGAIVACRADWR